ncbi:MAG TPA: hypothetical protein VJL83_01540 [Patescibacteria group bacterium]|nr:hypothetical protein [Patescibacteria group bacterium]
MNNQELHDYIKAQSASGVSQDQIRQALIQSGWKENNVDEALRQVFSPREQTSSPPQQVASAQTTIQATHTTSSFKHTLFGGIVLIIFIAGGALAYYLLNRLPESSVTTGQSNQTAPPTLTTNARVSTIGTELTPNINTNMSIVDTFFLLISMDIQRFSSGYSVSENLTPILVDVQEEHEKRMKHIESQKDVQTRYKIETVAENGDTEVFYTTGMYCPPKTDVCETLLDKEIPLDSSGTLGPVSLYITPDIKAINIIIDDNVIMSLNRRLKPIQITGLSKIPTAGGVEIRWEIETSQGEKIWSLFQYSSGPDTWGTVHFGPNTLYPEYNKSAINLNSIQSSQELLDVRLVATDGFNTSIWLESDFIEITNKEIPVFVEGLNDEYRLNQRAYVEVSFIDPETGQGCYGSGCHNGANKGKYSVTWTSDKQTICDTDVPDGLLQYRFKKGGIHTFTLTIQHTEKPQLNAVRTFEVLVNDEDLFELNPNDCSF